MLVLAVWTLGLTAADSAVSTAADWRPSVRWRGFNLLEMFIKSGPDAQPKEFREEDFAFMKKWGFNFARLPMDYRFWIKNGDWNVFDEDHLKYIDRALALGRKYGVHVNICMHRAPGYTVARPAEPTNLFTDPETQCVCARHWAMFARRYKGIPNEELSFNLFNEPANVKDEVYASVAKLLIAAIHREDPNRFILADGLQWGSKPAWKLVGLRNVGQSTRGYAPHGVSHYLAPWAGTPSAKPVWPPVAGNHPRYADPGQDYLYRQQLAAWDDVRAAGTFVMAGEFGVWKKTPHSIVLDLVEDYLVLWKERNMGWAMWNLRGEFGILDSNRADVVYEEYDGHKLDRKLLDLLLKY